jgi:hypothetical protein
MGHLQRRIGEAGVVLVTPNREKLCNSLRLEFKATNNEAVLVRLDLAHEMGVELSCGTTLKLWSEISEENLKPREKR